MVNWTPQKPPFSKFKREIFLKAAKVSDFIYQIGEFEALRQPSIDVPLKKINTTEMQRKFLYIKKCLFRYRKLTGYGRGITAVQVGIPERFSVIFLDGTMTIIINPKVLRESTQLLKYPEICMSANPIIAPTIRPAWIEFEYYDDTGRLNYWKQKDDTEMGRMMNRVFQHEIDHMNGIINIDRVEEPNQLILESDPNFYENAKFEAL